jgi:hypothetical protein
VANVTGANAILAFQGTQSFNNATINLGSATTAGNLNNEGAGTLTLGPGVTVQGRGTIGGQVLVGGSGTLINQGTLSANVSGQTLSIAGNGVSTFTNQGTLQALTGTTLTVSAANWSNALGATISDTNATVNLNNNWSNAGTVDQQSGTLRVPVRRLTEGSVQCFGHALTLHWRNVPDARRY